MDERELAVLCALSVSREAENPGIITIDLGSSCSKGWAYRITVADGEVMGIPHCNIFENDRCPAVVSLDKDILRGQGGYDLRLRDSTIKQAQNSYPGFSQSVATNPKRYITVSNPKQGMFLDLKEADMQKVLQEMGVKGTIKNAHDTGDGYVVLEFEHQGWYRFLNMKDVHGFLLWRALSIVKANNYFDSLVAVVVTVPNHMTQAHRAAVSANMQQQLEKFTGDSFLRHNQGLPPVLVVPEAVAAARQISEENRLADGTRMVVLDMGHMTVQSSLLTHHKGGLPTHLVHCSHPRRGVHDLQFKMLALIDQEKPGVLENINKHMETTGTTGKAHQFWDLMCKCVERASGCTNDDERLDLQVAQSMMVDDFLMEVLDAAGGITAGDVRKLRPVVGEAASKVIETLLTLNEMHAQTDADTADASATGYTWPTLVALTGGGCPMPEVIEAVKTCMGQRALPDQPVKLLLSKGGNSPVVAQGAALLGCDYLQQLLKQQGQLSQQEQQGVVRPQQQQDGVYSDLLPSLWPTRSGSRHIAVWCGFAPGKVREEYKTATQLRDLQLRVHSAAITPDGQPDWPKRKQDTQRLNSYLEHLISKTGSQQQQRQQQQQQQQQPRVNPPTGVPIFLSLLRPGEHLPRTASIPTLRKPPGDSLIRIKLLEIDQLYGGEEVLLTTYNVVGAKKNTDVDVSVQFSAEGRIDNMTAEAVVAISKGKIQRQPLEVVLQQHDSMEPARKDQQKALGRLPELAQKFQSLRSGLLLEADKPATPPPAAAAASAAAAGNAGSSAGLGASASSPGAGFNAPAASGAPGRPGAIPQDAWHDADAVAAAYGGNGGQPSPEFVQQLQALMMLQQQQHQQQQPLLHQQPQQPLLHQQPPFVGMDSTALAAEAAAAAFMQALTPQVRQQLLENTVQYAAAIGAQHAVPFGVPGSLLPQHHNVQHAVHVHNIAAGVAYQAEEPIQPNRLQAALPLQLLAQEPLSAGADRHGIPMSASPAAMATATARGAGSGGASTGQGVKRRAHAGATGYEPAYKHNS